MLQSPSPSLVLASASHSRRALLEAAGLVFIVKPADIDETAARREALAVGEDAEQAALRLADMKAAEIAVRLPECLVIGADQILVCSGVWFEKPVDLAAAATQLRALRGQTHSLATAVTCHQGEKRLWHAVVSPSLTMRHFSERFLQGYLTLEGLSVTSTVGAYRLEGRGAHLFEAVDGDQSAVLGLPLLPLLGFLRRAGHLLA
jgi:nucleoside triphosphate pyrophosphatase